MCLLRANYGPRMAGVMLPALTQITDPQDMVVLNFGLWSNSMEELSMHAQMFEAAFNYHRSLLPNRTYWRETSAQHYSTLSGVPRLLQPGLAGEAAVVQGLPAETAAADAGMYDSAVPIAQQRCRALTPGTNITVGVEGGLMPVPEAGLPEKFTPEEWELKMILGGGHRNAATRPVVDRLELHTIPAWNTSAAFWNVSLRSGRMLIASGLVFCWSEGC